LQGHRREENVSQDIHRGFQDVARSRDSEFFLQFLDSADALDTVQSCKRRMLNVLPIMEGAHVLDIGCGIGHELQRLVSLVGPRGRLVGIDKSDAMVEEARRRAAASRYSIEYQTADAHELPFADESFDYCRAERVLMYAQDPERILAEMVRVLRPGGGIVVFEFDYSGAMISASDRDLARRVQQELLRSMPSGVIGCRLPYHLQRLELRDVRVVPHAIMTPYWAYQRVVRGTLEQAQAAAVFEAAELDAWWAELERASQEGHFLAAFPGFIVSGRKI
jgi:ubiquinone/menaquinone biosynthesis C-methylase UbiE